jgi:hypothetical protein
MDDGQHGHRGERVVRVVVDELRGRLVLVLIQHQPMDELRVWDHPHRVNLVIPKRVR